MEFFGKAFCHCRDYCGQMMANAHVWALDRRSSAAGVCGLVGLAISAQWK